MSSQPLEPLSLMNQKTPVKRRASKKRQKRHIESMATNAPLNSEFHAESPDAISLLHGVETATENAHSHKNVLRNGNESGCLAEKSHSKCMCELKFRIICPFLNPAGVGLELGGYDAYFTELLAQHLRILDVA